MVFHNICSTKLTLSLGSNENTPLDDQIKIKTSEKIDPSLALGLYADQVITPVLKPNRKQHEKGSSVSGISSFSIGSVKREREVGVEESTKFGEGEGEDEDEEGPRKKLRLTKKQSIVLEDSFKEHTTLNPRQKQALANMLNLRPRQVEVWFQNRRARMKLKQTEIDSELLKKYCESLREENRRLNKELQDLKATKGTAPFYMQLPATTINIMCPSCQRIGEIPSNMSFSVGAKSYFYSPFTNPSAAC